MDPQAAIDFLEHWGYPAFTVLLLATGFGSPLPEDVLLLAAGYLVSAGVFSWTGACGLGLIGVVGSDHILYFAGSRLRAHARTRAWVRRMASRPGVSQNWLRRYGATAVFFARLVPGTRYICFISAGLNGLPLRRFLVLDVLGAAIWVPLLLFIGDRLGDEIGGIDAIVRSAGHIVLGTIVAVVIAVTAWRRFVAL